MNDERIVMREVPEWLIRCHWCATNYDRRRYWLLAPHRYHWLCWVDLLRANSTGTDAAYPPVGLDERRCSECGVVKPLGEFWRKRSAPKGRSYRCRSCWHKREERMRNEMRGPE